MEATSKEHASKEDQKDCMATTSNVDFSTKVVKMKPPCKKKFQEMLDNIWSRIKSHEAELKSLQSSMSIETDEQMKSLKHQRSVIATKRNEIAIDLENLQKSFCVKKGNLMRLQPNFQYKSEAHINNAISKLEYQLKMNNFRASEERKIVSEIDSLNRSKKSLAEYMALKDELNTIRQRQAALRKEKDNIFNKVQSIKTQEHALKTQESIKQQSMDKIKKRLDELHQEKRGVVAQHKKEIAEFEQLKEQRSMETMRKKEEEHKALHSAKIKEMEEETKHIKPFQEEELLCDTLISYLQRYEFTPTTTPSYESFKSPVSSLASTPVSPVAKQLQSGETVYVIGKKDLDDQPSHSSRKVKKSRMREKKRPQNKMLHHAPKVIEQFGSLNLRAPSTAKEIPVSMEQLKAKRKYYSHLVKNPEAGDAEHVICFHTEDDTPDEQFPTCLPSRFTLPSSNSTDQSSVNLLMDHLNSINMIDDGYSEVPVSDDPVTKETKQYEGGSSLGSSGKPSDTCCSNSSDADSALAEEIKSLESPDIVSSENRFSSWTSS